MHAATHRLSNVLPHAISLVKRGANGQSFFLRKSDGAVLVATTPELLEQARSTVAAGTIEPLTPLPRPADLIHKSDWSSVYCVVASPSAVENGGQLSPDVWDQWASPDEIRKAAHAFMHSGALINKLHEDLEPYGKLVENAIALADIEIDGHTIEKGSWYIAIEPTAEGKAAIEAGEFTGVSIEGTGTRVEVEKADPKKQGKKGVDRAGASSAQTCPSCRGKVTKGAKKCQNCGRSLSGATGTNVKKTGTSRLLGALAKALGIDPDDFGDDIADDALEDIDVSKASVATFAQRIAAREVEDDLPMATDALRGAIYDAIYPYAYGYSDPPEPAEARAALDESLQQFHDYLLGVFDRVVSNDIAKSRDELLGDLATLGNSEGTDGAETEEEVDMDKIAKLEAEVADIKKSVGDLVAGLTPVIEKHKEETAPTVEDLHKAVGTLTEQLGTIAKGVERLGAGGSTQTDFDTDGGGDAGTLTVVRKSDGAVDLEHALWS